MYAMRSQKREVYFFQPLANDGDKKKMQRIGAYLKHLLIFISRKKTREKTAELVVELSKIQEKDRMARSTFILRTVLFQTIKKVVICSFLKERMTILKEKWNT